MYWAAFFSAFFDQWILLVGGGIMSVLAAVWGYARHRQVDDTVLWPTVIATFMACIVAWSVEHQARLDAEAKVTTETESRQARFDATFENIVFLNLPPPGAAEVYVQLRIIGQGHPSIAGGYRLNISAAEGVRSFVHSGIPRDLWNDRPEGARRTAERLHINAGSALDERTVTPIAAGFMQVGWLRFQVPPVTVNAFLRETSFISVTFEDYLRQQHEAAADPATLLPMERVAPQDCFEFICPGLAP